MIQLGSFVEHRIMNMALVKQHWQENPEPLYFRQAESRVTMELDNVAPWLEALQ
jgi:hypothetical protein